MILSSSPPRSLLCIKTPRVFPLHVCVKLQESWLEGQSVICESSKLPQPAAQSCCNCVTQANARRHRWHALCSSWPITGHPFAVTWLMSSEHAHGRARWHLKCASKSRPAPSDWLIRLHHDYVSSFCENLLVEREIASVNIKYSLIPKEIKNNKRN